MSKHYSPKPNFECPECGSKNFFWHCVKRNPGKFPLDYIIDWGNLATCLECKTPYNVAELIKHDKENK